MTEWIVLLCGCAEMTQTETGVLSPTVLAVPQVSQYPELPTGCEATAAAMVLQYYGEAVNGHSAHCTATVLRGRSLRELYDTYVAAGKPLLIWATMDMREVKDGNRWRLPDGTDFVWPAGEHCLVLIGETGAEYLFNDPQTGGRVHYEKGLCEQRFRSLRQQAVYICK